MENENTDRTLQIALGSYDRKELRVQKNYIQEQCAGVRVHLLSERQPPAGAAAVRAVRFDAVILCSQLEDMSGLEFLMNIRSMDPKAPECCSV